MASRSLLIPPSYLPYIFNAAAVLGLIPIVAGTIGLLQPQQGISLLQFQNPHANSDQPAQRTAEGLFRMYAVRQIYLGFTHIAMWYTGSHDALGWALLAGVLVAGTDSWVAERVTGTHVAGHLAAVPMSLFMGTALLGWL